MCGFFLWAQYCGVVSIGSHLRNSLWCLTWDHPTSGSLPPLASARDAVRNDADRDVLTLE